ncbi:unnamed protein product [Danaus chrysippus]|uniref:(African queen) hypothetical protein n=1 Tax=Danaus chrysippus TaxID=151541 RepID=A0A8J2QG17_9NEOP|nr:unnamed protein product [Danaus chrysippus]
MNTTLHNNKLFIFVSAMALLFTIAASVPMQEEEQVENALVPRADDDSDMSVPWDALNTAALRKLLLQLDADDRLNMGRVGRSWPQAEPRGWGLRAIDGRLARQWRADKRQVRFRQCYFNPISCFRK